jgi:hypothetical protein
MSSYDPQGSSSRNLTPVLLLAILPVISCCFLGFVPPIVVAAKAKTRSSAMWATGFVVGYLAGLAMVGVAPDSDTLLASIGVSLFMVAAIGGTAYAVIVGSRLNWSSTTAAPVFTPPAHDPNPAAVAEVMALRRKREEARQLAARDSQMARDLRIGRPDLPRQYDDGGLIDINSAPAETLVKWLGLTQAQAQQVIQTRDQLGRFERMEELMTLAGLEPATYDGVAERIVLL